MVTEAEAEEWILDCDGSCRDVTFTPTSKEAVGSFVKFLLQRYQVTSTNDCHGLDRVEQLQKADPCEAIDSVNHVVMKKDDRIISQLQLFIDEEQELCRYCVEVTFFPDDINRQLFSFGTFHSMIEQWNEILQSKDYFIRYENVSWEHYNPNGSGVIYSRNQPPVT